MSQTVDDLWSLVDATPRIDAQTLARAVEKAAASAEDFRTRVLIRDSVRAIEDLWGKRRFNDWLTTSSQRGTIEAICQTVASDSVDEHGFPSLKRRIVDAIKPENILAYFRDLSSHVGSPTRLIVGGAIPLILSGYLQRATEDIDVVDEVPANIRTQHKFLEELEDQYGLQLTHFQSHYLPAGWEQRLHSVGTFGMLDVLTIDACDVFLAKLFSERRKDKEDLRAILPNLDQATIERRLREAAGSFLADAKLRKVAEQNWYVLFGKQLPG